MTRIEFHFNTHERLLHTCRLVRKARAQDLRIAVVGAPTTLKQLDAELGGFRMCPLWRIAPRKILLKYKGCRPSHWDLTHTLGAWMKCC